jgi:hypothetical protein
MAVKISTVLYVIAAVLFGLAAAAFGKDFPIVDAGLAFTASGLAVGSVGR